MKDKLFIALQYIVPHHLFSRFVGLVAESRWAPIKNTFIRHFAKQFQVNMAEAKIEDLSAFENFNDFFTRELKDNARPITTEENAIAQPADGAISQLGPIKDGSIFQAKGQSFSLVDLLGGDSQRALPFMNGDFSTIYLSPKDYHRLHMPLKGTLREMIYVPGKLFSVNPTTAQNVPSLFSRNERVVAIFDTEAGPMAMVLVGAMIVASIETVWAGLVTPPKRELKTVDYSEASRQPIVLEKGQEMGRFKLGSTVVLCFGPDVMKWAEEYKEGSPTRMGETLGYVNS